MTNHHHKYAFIRSTNLQNPDRQGRHSLMCCAPPLGEGPCFSSILCTALAAPRAQKQCMAWQQSATIKQRPHTRRFASEPLPQWQPTCQRLTHTCTYSLSAVDHLNLPQQQSGLDRLLCTASLFNSRTRRVRFACPRGPPTSLCCITSLPAACPSLLVPASGLSSMAPQAIVSLTPTKIRWCLPIWFPTFRFPASHLHGVGSHLS